MTADGRRAEFVELPVIRAGAQRHHRPLVLARCVGHGADQPVAVHLAAVETLQSRHVGGHARRRILQEHQDERRELLLGEKLVREDLRGRRGRRKGYLGRMLAGISTLKAFRWAISARTSR